MVLGLAFLLASAVVLDVVIGLLVVPSPAISLTSIIIVGMHYNYHLMQLRFELRVLHHNAAPT